MARLGISQLAAALALVAVSASSAFGDAACEIGCGSYCRSGEQDLSCRACYNRCNSSSGASGGGGRSYGAIAAPSDTGEFYGYSYGKSSRGVAEQTALANCEAQAGKRGACEIAQWFYNNCAALAIGADSAWGSAHAATTGAASSKAMALCKENDDSGACHVVTSFCSR
jgi:hypothetical protein